jgi:hypothetical protein
MSTQSFSLLWQKISTAVTAIKITVFLDVTPCSSVDVQRNLLPVSSWLYQSSKLCDVTAQAIMMLILP